MTLLSDAEASSNAARRSVPAAPAPETDSVAMSAAEQVADVRSSVVGGDPVRIAARHRDGRWTARERIEQLVDPGSFVELDVFRRRRPPQDALDHRAPHGDGVVVGFGMVDGRHVAISSQDAMVLGGSLGAEFAAKVAKVMDLAAENGVPYVNINDGGGARIQEGVDSLAGFGAIFTRHVRMSGVVPQIAVVLGPCAGGAAYAPALCDLVVMSRTGAHLYLTGPAVVRQALGEDVTHDELGGSEVHAQKSGLCALVGEDEADCLELVREVLALLPPNLADAPPGRVVTTDRPERATLVAAATVPGDHRLAYDVRRVIDDVLDQDASFLELSAEWARNLVVGLGQLDGRVVGVVANQPAHLAGSLDGDASAKGARFVRLCDRFRIPLLTLVDVPGFLPGPAQERDGIIRHGAKLLYAFCEASVPRVTVVLRKAYGGAWIVMNSRSVGADLVFAWPDADAAVLGPDAAVEVLYARKLERQGPEARAGLRQRVVDALHHPLAAAEGGHVDDIIDPADTRRLVVRSFELLLTKRATMPMSLGNLPT